MNPSSEYRIGQDCTYAGKDYWHWWSWIEASDAALDRIHEVVWVLHPSFSSPRVPVDNRKTKFRLDASGWGTFRLRAELLNEKGEVFERLSDDLRLDYPDEPSRDRPRSAPTRGVEAPPPPPPARGAQASPPTSSAVKPRARTVFFSYSTEDAPLARKWIGAIRDEGIEVLSADQVKPGEPWDDSIARMIRGSDVVIGYVNAEFASPFVISELQAAQRAEKRVAAIVQPSTSPAGLPGDIERIELSTGPDGERTLTARIASLTAQA